MPAHKPTAEQLRYLSHFASHEAQFSTTGWTTNPLAAWRATHPEGTSLSEKQLLWRVAKQFTAMKAQGWVTETHVEHHLQDDEVNSRRVEETLYRITERGKQALVEAGAAPVVTRRVSPAPEAEVAETVVFSEGPADGRVVTLPVGRHDHVLFSVGGREVRYRRSRRPEVDGHPVFIPADPAPQPVGA